MRAMATDKSIRRMEKDERESTSDDSVEFFASEKCNHNELDFVTVLLENEFTNSS